MFRHQFFIFYVSDLKFVYKAYTKLDTCFLEGFVRNLKEERLYKMHLIIK